MFLNRYSRSIGATLAIGILVTGTAGYLFATRPSLRMEFIQSPLVQFLLPTYRSLRKLADIPYLPYQFLKDDLPVYNITIDVADIARINATLPDDFVKGRLTDEYKLKVRAGFSTSGYEDRINIRYRGRGPNHWNAFKKSFHIEFDDNTPFNGNSELKLIIPEDRQYAIEPLNNYRAEKLGVFAPQPWFVRVRLNGDDMGVYHAIPHWSSALTDRNGFGEYANIFGLVDLQLDELAGRNFFDPAEIALWEDYTRNANRNQDNFTRLQEFLAFIHNAPDTLYAEALPAYADMDALYAWLILNTLGGSAHQNATVNIILFQNPATGRFQPVPWDIQMYPANTINLASHPLIGRTLAVPEFREEFLQRLGEYVGNGENVKDDLRFFDETIASIKPALYKDTAKLPLNFVVGRDIAEDRRLVENNFNFIQTMFEEKREHELFENKYTNYKPQDNFQLTPFASAVIQSAPRFLVENRQFYPSAKTIDERAYSLRIGPGVIILRKTVILPLHAQLVIASGTTLLMEANASLVTFQPIIAEGTKEHPITIRGRTNEPWGALLVLGNNAGTSTVAYAHFSGGSGFQEHSITATGMLAIHQGNAKIHNSIFENTHNDDAVNIKWGSIIIENSTFRNTLGDAIDLDSAAGTIQNNTFYSIGREAIKNGIPNGDAIDISFSAVIIINNTVDTCGDKGISIGEMSYPVVINNTIKNCVIGISVKDLSNATIESATLVGNSIGIEAKQKKPLFGGGRATMKNSTFENNGKNVLVDAVSQLHQD